MEKRGVIDTRNGISYVRDVLMVILNRNMDNEKAQNDKIIKYGIPQTTDGSVIRWYVLK